MLHIFIIIILLLCIITVFTFLEFQPLQEIKYKPNILRLSKVVPTVGAAILALHSPFVQTEFANKILATLALNRLLDDAVADHADQLVDEAGHGGVGDDVVTVDGQRGDVDELGLHVAVDVILDEGRGGKQYVSFFLIRFKPTNLSKILFF